MNPFSGVSEMQGSTSWIAGDHTGAFPVAGV